ncbi:thiolase family protein [Rhodococcus sp. WS4]|nr:thiolase family protein [Rhodococcus sp. WS4]
MALRGNAAIAGVAEYPPERRFAGPGRFTIEQWADLAALALEDAAIDPRQVDGLICSTDVYEAANMVPAVLAEYCGWNIAYAERVDLGGASAVGMVWRAAMAIEAGICRTVVCALPARPRPARPEGELDLAVVDANSTKAWGSPVGRYQSPYGNVGPNVGYALVASHYDGVVGGGEEARAKLVADQRRSAAMNPDAVHYKSPILPEDVLASRIVAPPLHLLEIVMPCTGGAAIVVTAATEVRSDRRPVVVSGFGEATSFYTPTYNRDLLRMPLRDAADRSFAMAGMSRDRIDMVQLYDPYSIAVVLSLENAGFCSTGEGNRFVLEHDLTYEGDFPCNTNGGQLGVGQARNAGGMTHVIEAVRQIQGTAGDRQLSKHDTAFISGSGGSMAAQAALILEGV